VLTTAKVSPFWKATTEAPGAFKAAVLELLDKLKTFRNELSLSAGAPMVDRLNVPMCSRGAVSRKADETAPAYHPSHHHF